MRYFLLFILILKLPLLGCETLFFNENNQEPVSAVIQNDIFIIKNNLNFDIYFFAVDQETSYVIDWMPVESEENRVKAGSVRKFSTEVIVGFEEGRTAIVYVWNGDSYWQSQIIEQYPEL